MAFSSQFFLNNFKDSLDNMYNFYNSFSKGISYNV